MLAALLSAAGLWLILTWPLPRHVRDGIPYAAHAPAGEVARAMAPGDHLQLLYHFWLMRDMIAGSTPWFHNLYEFNTGDDAERYRPGAYFAPFSLAFTLGDLVGGRALGWHLATGLSLWLAFWSSWLLACRYTSSERVAWVVAVLVTAFPYRWHNLMSGSPTGFGMAWTPLLMWGLDRAIRDGSWRGGLWAGLAMVGSAWAEKHVMFFNALLIPHKINGSLASFKALPPMGEGLVGGRIHQGHHSSLKKSIQTCACPFKGAFDVLFLFFTQAWI